MASHRRRHADSAVLTVRRPSSESGSATPAWAAGTSWWSPSRRRTSCAGWRWPRWARWPVPADRPAPSPSSLGLVRQVKPRVIVTDAALRPLVVEAGAPLPVEVLDVNELLGDWTGKRRRPLVDAGRRLQRPRCSIPTSGTRGSPSSRHADPPRLRDGGVGFPYWMELTAEDRLMTSLPLFHINAPAYSVLGSLAVGAGLVLLPRFSGQWVPGLGATPWRDRVQRDRGDVGDPDASAGSAPTTARPT